MTENAPILYASPAEHIARITLNRPEARNAQDTELLYALNDAFDRAAQDDEIKVIILDSTGPHFSAGHDLREGWDVAEQMKDYDSVGTWCGFSCDGSEARMAREKEIYIGLSERWRNIPKPTIAAVQGKCISGGLMLVWPCDLIVAADDALFRDNTIDLGVGGVEYFAMPWELGTRRAKELLFTSGWLTAEEARTAGMVNHIVRVAELAEFTLKLAKKIASKPGFALKLAKEAVNAAEDAQGRVAAMNTAFILHQLAHSHNMQVHGMPVDPSGVFAGAKKGAPEN